MFEESRRGGCEMEQYMGGKVWFQLQIFRIIDVSTPCMEAEHCQQLHLMGKGNNEFLITESPELSDLICTDTGTEFSQPLHLPILKS